MEKNGIKVEKERSIIEVEKKETSAIEVEQKWKRNER